MPRVKCWQVDAFTDRPFAGNPAAVCLLDAPAPADWMQSVAAEMNLSETAFVRPLERGWELRWFTPAVEVDLCGHATLASAHALWEAGVAPAGEPLRFHTKSGVLTCTWGGEAIELDFPSLPAQQTAPDAGLLEALGVAAPRFVGRAKFDELVVVDSPAELRGLAPDFRRLAECPARGAIVTAPSDDPRYDFLSRYFAPAEGIDEDPVTGSAHCTLAPYWSARLGRPDLAAWQASRRGGLVRMRCAPDRITLIGRAVTVWEGELRC
jgi:PhzF family phenazine biosynthesis protein